MNAHHAAVVEPAFLRRIRMEKPLLRNRKQQKLIESKYQCFKTIYHFEQLTKKKRKKGKLPIKTKTKNNIHALQQSLFVSKRSAEFRRL
jgi:hypothetical protein